VNNEGKKKGRGCYAPARRSREYLLSLQTLLYLLDLLAIPLSPTLDVLQGVTFIFTKPQ
jgi:hypothetical protein